MPGAPALRAIKNSRHPKVSAAKVRGWSADQSPALGDRVLDVLEDVALEVSEGVEVDVQRVVMAVGRFLNGGVVPSKN